MWDVISYACLRHLLLVSPQMWTWLAGVLIILKNGESDQVRRDSILLTTPPHGTLGAWVINCPNNRTKVKWILLKLWHHLPDTLLICSPDAYMRRWTARYHCFRWWLSPVHRQAINQHWLIANWIVGNKLQWNLNQNPQVLHKWMYLKMCSSRNMSSEYMTLCSITFTILTYRKGYAFLLNTR